LYITAQAKVRYCLKPGQYIFKKQGLFRHAIITHMEKSSFLLKTTLFAFFVLLSQLALAQKVTVSGVIKNEEESPLRGAIIKDLAGDKVKTDSTGSFKLMVNAPAKLKISCVGYRDTTIKVTAAIELDITLRGGVNIADRNNHFATDAQNSIMMAPFETAMQSSSVHINPLANRPELVNVPGMGKIYVQRGTEFTFMAGSTFPVFNPKEETKGSRYFYKNWVHGAVINTKGEINSGEKYLFNYDKIGGGLLATKDRHSAIEVYRDQVSFFITVSSDGDTVTFANVPQIDPTHYVQLLSSGNKYKIYKAIKTNFTKANYHTDGIASTGNNYDEYVDEISYYVINVQTNQMQKIALKKKAIKDVFAKEGDKLAKFMSNHSSDDIDDFYLSSLGSTLNEQ